MAVTAAGTVKLRSVSVGVKVRSQPVSVAAKPAAQELASACEFVSDKKLNPNARDSAVIAREPIKIFWIKDISHSVVNCTNHYGYFIRLVDDGAAIVDHIVSLEYCKVAGGSCVCALYVIRVIALECNRHRSQ